MNTEKSVTSFGTLKEQYRSLRTDVDQLLDEMERIEKQLVRMAEQADAEGSGRFSRSVRNLALEIGVKINPASNGKRRGRPRKTTENG